MKHGIELGEEIIINTRKIPNVHPNWKEKEMIIAEVTGRKGYNGLKISVDVYKNDAEHLFPSAEGNTGTGYTVLESIISVICNSCEGKKVYHDEKEKYFCPFCKEDY